MEKWVYSFRAECPEYGTMRISTGSIERDKPIASNDDYKEARIEVLEELGLDNKNSCVQFCLLYDPTEYLKQQTLNSINFKQMD